jgi:hypothetical protein
MRKLMFLFLLVLVLSSAVTVGAQEASVVFHPGETVHILVTFKAPPVALDGAVFSFGLLTQVSKDQEALGRNFQGDQIKKITDTQFEISGKVLEHCASGTYRLNWISVTVKGTGKQYNEGSDFKEITIAVLNPERPEFPTIDDVRISH